MRSAGCAINDYRRPQFRPAREAHARRGRSPRGEIAPREALVVAAVLAARGLRAGAVPQPLRDRALVRRRSRSPRPIPFTKRFFALPQACLGIAFGFGIPMAYAAVQRQPAAGMLAAARGERLLCVRLRHRVRDGRPRRRREARHPHLGAHARTLGRRRGDGELRARCSRPARRRRRRLRARLAVLRRARAARRR